MKQRIPVGHIQKTCCNKFMQTKPGTDVWLERYAFAQGGQQVFLCFEVK